MLFKVTAQDKIVELSMREVLDLLMSKHTSIDERKDFTGLSLEFAKFMQFKEAMHEASLAQLILIAFSLGYFYRVFREKNEVEVIDASSNHTDTEPSSS